MSDARFTAPVIARLPLAKEGPAVKALEGPREGIQAIYQYGLGAFQFENAAFLQTVEKLMAAARCPTPENLETARAALEALADSAAAGPARHRLSA